MPDFVEGNREMPPLVQLVFGVVGLVGLSEGKRRVEDPDGWDQFF